MVSPSASWGPTIPLHRARAPPPSTRPTQASLVAFSLLGTRTRATRRPSTITSLTVAVPRRRTGVWSVIAASRRAPSRKARPPSGTGATFSPAGAEATGTGPAAAAQATGASHPRQQSPTRTTQADLVARREEPPTP